MRETEVRAVPVDGRDHGPPLWSKPVVSWALYDLANTIFSFNILSYFLSVWVIEVMGYSDTAWARTLAVSMFLILLTAPVMGAISDRAGRRLSFLLVSTLACVTLTFFLGIPGVAGTLVLLVGANFFFQAGLIFYDSLLPVVSSPENRGRVSGLGIGLGYVGSFIGLGVGTVLLGAFGYPAVFKGTALLFLVFAIPVFIFVREPKRPRTSEGEYTVRGAFAQVANTVRQVKHFRGLGRFLVGRAFYTDAANTLILFMGPYVVADVGFDETTGPLLMGAAIAAAIVGGFVWGPVVDRVGPKRTLNMVMACWVVTLVAAALVPLLGLPRSLFWGVASLAGISLGGTWASDRPLMLILSPPARIGEFYGLYSMVGRFSAVIGPIIWAFVAEDLGLGRPASVLVLAMMVVVAAIILRPVDDRARDWTPGEMGTDPAAWVPPPG